MNAPIRESNSAPKSNGDSFIENLERQNIQVIDNRKQSGIIWILYDRDKKALIESIISKHNFKASLEKRGAIATGNRPAWRVMV